MMLRKTVCWIFQRKFRLDKRVSTNIILILQFIFVDPFRMSVFHLQFFNGFRFREICFFFLTHTAIARENFQDLLDDTLSSFSLSRSDFKIFQREKLLFIPSRKRSVKTKCDLELNWSFSGSREKIERGLNHHFANLFISVIISVRSTILSYCVQHESISRCNISTATEYAFLRKRSSPPQRAFAAKRKSPLIRGIAY